MAGIRKRDSELGSYLGTNCPHVELLTETGKKRKTLAGNTKDAEKELGRPVSTRQNYISTTDKKKKLEDKK